jgi:Transposase, Mutator family
MADRPTTEGAMPLTAEAWAWITERLERDPRLMRTLLQAFAEELMAVDADGRCRAATGPHLNRRTGYRQGVFATPYGPIPVKVPELRQGGYAPAWLIFRAASADEMLIEALCRSYVEEMSSRLVADVVAALGVEGISPAQDSVIAAAINSRIGAERTRPLLEARGSDVIVDTVGHAGRLGDGTVAISVATTSLDDECDVLGVACGPDAATAVQGLRRDLAARGLIIEGPSDPTVAPRTRPVMIVVRRHGRGSGDTAALFDDEGLRRRSIRRTLLLLAVVAVVVIAAAIIASASRLRSDPVPPPATTISAAFAREALAPAVASSAPPPSSLVPPPSSPATTLAAATPDRSLCVDAATTPADNTAPADRVPWMNQVQCEAAAPPPPG